MELVKVKREGGKGWRLITREKFEQGGHEAYDAPVIAEPEAPKPSGKKPKAK